MSSEQIACFSDQALRCYAAFLGRLSELCHDIAIFLLTNALPGAVLTPLRNQHLGRWRKSSHAALLIE